jgi:hypothetical protein
MKMQLSTGKQSYCSGIWTAACQKIYLILMKLSSSSTSFVKKSLSIRREEAALPLSPYITYVGSEVHSKNVHSLSSLNTFQQNSMGLRKKSYELIHSFEADGINPTYSVEANITWLNRIFCTSY